jgi:hypothetical protein
VEQKEHFADFRETEATAEKALTRWSKLLLERRSSHSQGNGGALARRPG